MLPLIGPASDRYKPFPPKGEPHGEDIHPEQQLNFPTLASIKKVPLLNIGINRPLDFFF